MAAKYHLRKFPPKNLDWAKLIPLIGPASAGLVRYEGLLSAIPNVHVLLSPLTTQEAVLSSKIEGTHVTMGEVLEIEAGGQPDLFSQTKRDDAEEVLNYRAAMRACVSEMGRRPFSQQILRAAHGLLMKGVRGRDMNPAVIALSQSLRLQRGWTQEEAAEQCGLAPQLYGFYEIGVKNNPGLKTLQKIAQGFDMEVYELLGPPPPQLPKLVSPTRHTKRQAKHKD